MKKKIMLMLTVAGALLAQTNYSGIYNGQAGFASAKYGSVPMTAQMTLLQAGSTLKGTFKGGNGKPLPLTGSVTSSGTLQIVVNNGAISGSLIPTGTGLQGTLSGIDGQTASVILTKN